MRSFNLVVLLLFPLNFAAASLIDAKYRSQMNSSQGTTGQVYSKVVKGGYTTDCNMEPTDSQYVSAVAKKCGMGQALIMGVGRFFNEPDAGALGYSQLSGFKKMSYEDQAPNCDSIF